jgi:hypothetical protein
LLDNGRVAEACDKLEESQRLDPAGGTLLNLAKCHELEGKLALAWADYVGAAELAKRAGRNDRVKLAKERAEALRPQLAELKVLVIESVPDLVLLVDGVELREGSYGVSLPVDPRVIVVDAAAPGYVARRLMTEKLRAGEKAVLELPPLEKMKNDPPQITVVPPEPPLAPRDIETPRMTEPLEQRGGDWLLPAGLTLSGIGVAACSVAAVFGGLAIDEGETAKERCPTRACDAIGFEAVEAGRRDATVANVTGAVGGTMLLTGVAFLLIGRTSDAPGFANASDRGLAISIAKQHQSIAWKARF